METYFSHVFRKLGVVVILVCLTSVGIAAPTHDSVQALCAKLAPPSTGGDGATRIELKSVVDRAARAGAESERRVLAAVLVDALNTATDVEIQDFLLEMLRFVASPAEVPVAAKFLTHERLSDRAIALLITVRDAAAERALVEGLGKAPAERAGAFIKALGDIGSAACVPECIKRLDVAEAGLRSDVLYTLAQSADPRVGTALKARLKTDDVAMAYLRYGERLAELGKQADAAAVAAALPDKPTGVRCGKLALLAATQGRAAVPALLAVLDDSDASIREQAIRQLAQLKAERLVSELTAAARAAKGAKRAALLDAISRRGDVFNAELFVEALKDDDESVRSVAIQSLKRIGNATAARALLPISDQPAARDALLAMRGNGVDFEIAKGLATPAMRVAALELLTKRRATLQAPAIVPFVSDPDAKVAQAACDALGVLAGGPELEQLIAKSLATDNTEFRQRTAKAIASAAVRNEDNERSAKLLAAGLPGAPAAQRDWIVALLPAMGGQAALDALVAMTTGTDESVLLSAVRALADWRDEAAVDPLLALSRGGGDERQRVLAVRGAIRLIEQAAWEKAEKVAKLKPLIEAAPRAEEKQLVEAAIKRVEAANQAPRRKKK